MWIRASALALLAGLLMTSTSAGQVPATILTTTGETASGTLSELSSMLRLVTPIPPHIGPANSFDIPIEEIQQITIDFPRVIVETAELVFIGPWSAFEGIPESVIMERGIEELAFSTAGLRAIALNNNALHEVPREWLGDGFLTHPRVLRRAETIISRSTSARTSSTTTQTTSGQDLTLPPEGTIDDLFPTFPVESEPEQQDLPWWIVLIGAGVLAAIALLGTGGGSSP
jgi:hypothetical protein